MAAKGGRPSCIEVVESIQDYLPALYFTFSRGKTELLAEELGREWDFLFADEKKAVSRYITESERENPNIFGDRRKSLRQLLTQGIGYHHAGLSPALKDLVERLYENRLIHVLFCTETFAVGVNFPAASTVFDSCRKWDGQEFRGLLNREFFQMAGRAGRRGFDEAGRVYIRIDERFSEQTGFYDESEVEPVRGRLIISPNTVLSLLYWKTDEEINSFLEKNLAVYQNSKETRKLKNELHKMESRLGELGSCFCTDKDTSSCQLYRIKLRRELNQLSKRKRRGKPGARERREEIREMLQGSRKKCRYKVCVDAQKKLSSMTEKKTRLNRRIRSLERKSRDHGKDFQKVWRLLEQLGYVEGRQLLPRGLFGLHIHVQEILVTELVFSGILREVPPAEAAAILAGVDYRPGRDEQIIPGPYKMHYMDDLRKYLLKSGVPENFCVWSPVPGALATAWYQGNSFDDLLQMCDLQEGDIFSLIRREIDLLRQIERAAGEDTALKKQIEDLRRALDRDEVAILGL